MRLDNKELHRLFTNKGIFYLFHANTVATFITFIEQSGLMSRGNIEKMGLFQSIQSSDAIDKVHNVWNDIFADTVDIHGYFPRQNYYGPISMQFSIDFIVNESPEIWITKDNPINWSKNTIEQEKYFVSVEELERDWNLYERQRKMVTGYSGDTDPHSGDVDPPYGFGSVNLMA